MQHGPRTLEEVASALEYATPMSTTRPGGLSPSPGLLGCSEEGSRKESPKYRPWGAGT